MINNIIRQSWLFSIFLVFFLWPLSSIQGASFSFNSFPDEINVGSEIVLNLFLNTEGESINAVEGKIVFPTDKLELKSIKDGNSLINFWLDKKEVTPGEIIFSGITPGGIMIDNGLILSLYLRVIDSGSAEIFLANVSALLNDGEGSNAQISSESFKLEISQEIGDKEHVIVQVEDEIAPERFRPEIASDDKIFSGQHFITFATQDKGSGVKRYEVKETRCRWLAFLSPWKETTSPYLLTDQELKSYVFIKAVDIDGNVRVEITPPKDYQADSFCRLCAIIIVVIIASLIVWISVRRKKKN